MTQRTVTALFDSYSDATAAVPRIEALGIPHDDIAIVANKDASGRTDLDGTDRAAHAGNGAGTGATAGTILGGGAGLLAGLGMLAIPGLGPVVAAGWLAATAVGAGAGAALGGVVGALVGTGIPEGHAKAYEEGVRRGGTLVTVRAEESLAQRAATLLDEAGAVDLDAKQVSWRQTGWDAAPAATATDAAGRAIPVQPGASLQQPTRARVYGAGQPGLTDVEVERTDRAAGTRTGTL